MTTPSTVPSPALWTTDASGSRPTMMPVARSPTAMENLPLLVAHTTGPLTFWGWPPMVTCTGPAAADGFVPGGVWREGGPDPLSPFEQPATPATTVVATAINSSRFTHALNEPLRLVPGGQQPRGAHLVEARGRGVAVGQAGRGAVDQRPVDRQRRIRRADGVLALRVV